MGLGGSDGGDGSGDTGGHAGIDRRSALSDDLAGFGVDRSAECVELADDGFKSGDEF